ncbi:MAG: glycosyltransferase [Holophagaceae bacterium]|nr:glycosyltransferase [Holophagaceae bacterium]
MRRADLSMMVNNSIADEVQKIHKLPVRPLVIRNMANQWRIDPEVCLEKRKELCDRLQLPISTFLIMYHGGILRNRGIENLIHASARMDNIAVVILGNGESGYKQEIKTLANNVGFTHKLLFLDAVPVADLWQFVGAVDVGSVLIQNTCQSYYYSLPNKLFENVQAETPIIGSNFPEIECVVKQYKIGLCCDSGNVDDIMNVINQIKNDNILFNNLKYNIKLAKSELSWEKEKMILSNIYEKEFTKYQSRSKLNIRG